MARTCNTYGIIQKCVQSFSRKIWESREAVLRWEDNINIDLRAMGCDAGDCIDLVQEMVQWRLYVRAVMNLRVP